MSSSVIFLNEAGIRGWNDLLDSCQIASGLRVSMQAGFGFQFLEGASAMVVSIIITRVAVYGLALVTPGWRDLQAQLGLLGCTEELIVSVGLYEMTKRREDESEWILGATQLPSLAELRFGMTSIDDIQSDRFGQWYETLEIGKELR
ncbi:hypothetical protein CMUS01_01092 [Colletotrichum musicola]|uniref:Uncharacterized protein n=1 Tax=Colletotrichum musicola TaxID=2175873 RepID=A0A8H6NXT4_9PEZI|nr:hypothetical protein CMUS01_01092 [Colletotrichum musicola]